MPFCLDVCHRVPASTKLRGWFDRFLRHDSKGARLLIFHRLLIATGLVCSLMCASSFAQNERAVDDEDAIPAVRFDPVQRDIEGWTVHVDPALIEGESSQDGEKALMMLANHLQRIKILLPSESLKKLQTIEIWIELDHPRLNSMQYHPSKRWLVSNNHDPRLTRKVHITQARQLLSRQQMLKHPAVILHELAHGYHDQFLGFDNPEIEAVYDAAKEKGIYEDVLLYTGDTVRHYGLNNAKEYFAEGSEAFFYRNDFFPFVRAELERHDPELHELLARVWGVTTD